MMTALILSEIIVINQVAQKIITHAWLGICLANISQLEG